MPTLTELSKIITEACDRGDSVSAIAERAGQNRSDVSRLKNNSYLYSPTVEKVEAVCKAIGYHICIQKAKYSVAELNGGMEKVESIRKNASKK